MLDNQRSTFKRVGLAEDLHDARPKRLRFLRLNSVGKVVRHANETLFRFADALARTLADAPRRPFNFRRPSLAGV